VIGTCRIDLIFKFLFDLPVIAIPRPGRLSGQQSASVCSPDSMHTFEIKA